MAVIDHLVYAVPDLDDAIDRFDAALGVRPSVGGRHEGMGTWNALLALRNDAPPSYLELIAADPGQPSPSGPRPFGIDDDPGPRLVTFAIRPSPGETIEVLVERFRSHGHDPGDPVPMSRTTPDGDTLSWRLTFPTGVAGGLVPFLIDWGETPKPAETIEVAADLDVVGTSAGAGEPADSAISLLRALELPSFDLNTSHTSLAATISVGGRTLHL